MLTVEHMCFNAYSRTYVFQCLQWNICVSMLTVEHMCFNAYIRTYVFQRLQWNICVSMLTVEHMCFNGECSLRYPTVLCMSLIVRKLLISNGVVSVC